MKIIIDIPDELKPLFEAEMREYKTDCTIEEYAASRVEELIIDKGLLDSLYDDCRDRGIEINWDED